MKQYNRVIRAFYAHPWAILEAKLEALIEFFELKAQGLALSEEEIVARTNARPEPRRAGAVAVVPIFGVLAKRMDLATAISGGTSIDGLSAGLQELAADDGISAIVLDVDSPGGSVEGMTEFAAVLRELRKDKPIIAVADTLLASAAYWLASSTSEIVATPSAMVGSIGVISAHVDESEKNKQEGRKVTIIRSSPYKAAGTNAEPLSDEAFDERQGHVDHFAGLFRADIARGRGISVAKVRESFGEGKMFNATRAKALGMVDRVATLQEVLEGLASGAPASAGAAALDPAGAEQRLALALEELEAAGELTENQAENPENTPENPKTAENEADIAPIGAQTDPSDLARRKMKLRILELGG